MLKRTTIANFWRIVIKAFVVIYSYIWGYNQKYNWYYNCEHLIYVDVVGSKHCVVTIYLGL